jgi:hypothetical protein
MINTFLSQTPQLHVLKQALKGMKRLDSVKDLSKREGKIAAQSSSFCKRNDRYRILVCMYSL